MRMRSAAGATSRPQLPQGTRGRPVETVQAELQAAATWTSASSDPALRAHVDLIRREHAEAVRARRREQEEELLSGPTLEPRRES